MKKHRVHPSYHKKPSGQGDTGFKGNDKKKENNGA
jgi:hypothetical protein